MSPQRKQGAGITTLLARKTLYITAGKTLYKVPVNVSGYALYPPLK